MFQINSYQQPQFNHGFERLMTFTFIARGVGGLLPNSAPFGLILCFFAYKDKTVQNIIKPTGDFLDDLKLNVIYFKRAIRIRSVQKIGAFIILNWFVQKSTTGYKMIQVPAALMYYACHKYQVNTLPIYLCLYLPLKLTNQQIQYFAETAFWTIPLTITLLKTAPPRLESSFSGMQYYL